MTLKVTGAGSSWAVARRRLRLKLRGGGSCPKRVMTEWRAYLRIHVESCRGVRVDLGQKACLEIGAVLCRQERRRDRMAVGRGESLQ